MHLAPLIRDLAVILGVAGLVTLIFQRIRQPLVLGYIIAGIIVGPHTFPFPLIADIPNIQVWAELGVIFVMFSLGLEFSFRKLARVGIASTVTAGIEVVCTFLLGFLTGKLLGWNTLESLFLGAMISISSTTIIMKTLGELDLKTRRFASMILAILVVEDLIAILVLVALSTIAVRQSISGFALLTSAARLILVVGGWFVVGYFLVPRFMRYVGRTASKEMLTILSLGLCLALVVFADQFHYSTALGAFIMGSILAESAESRRISEQIEPLRDLFAAIFFVSVGMLIDPRVVFENWSAVLIITFVALMGKMLSATIASLFTGQSLRTSMQVGIGLAQIGEFSFIIAGVGLATQATSASLYPIGVAVALLMTLVTPHLVARSERLAIAIENHLPASIGEFLNRYSTWAGQRQADTAHRAEFRRSLLRWMINGVVVSVIFVLCGELLLPFLLKKGWLSDVTSPIVAWLTAMILSMPFGWAMMTSFRLDGALSRSSFESVQRWSKAFVFRLLTVLWIGVLSREFFPTRYVLVLLIAFGLVLFIIFFRRLELSYRWFETQFLATFRESERGTSPIEKLGHLAPWDAHLAKMRIHPNSPYVLKRLIDARLRSDHGLNIVAIQRGEQTIVAPKPEEVLLPDDDLLVLGEEEQIESMRPKMECPTVTKPVEEKIDQYGLRAFRISDSSPLAGKIIRESGIRERFDCMVVGIEREGRRLINPESDLPLRPGDTLWIVGEQKKLLKVSDYFFGV